MRVCLDWVINLPDGLAKALLYIYLTRLHMLQRHAL